MARKLIGHDLFSIARLMKKANLAGELSKVDFDNENKTAVGFEFILTILGSIGDAEDEFWRLLEDVSGHKEIKTKELEEIQVIIGEILEVNKIEDIKSFLKMALKFS